MPSRLPSLSRPSDAAPADGWLAGAASIRLARAADQEAIRVLVRSERLNPTKLNWENFRVVEADGRLVGAAQIRHHGDGSRELGSLVVAPEWRGLGLATALIGALLGGMEGPVHMITNVIFAPHYRRWGFVPIKPGAAPPAIRFNYWLGCLARVISWLKRLPPRRLVVLRRPALPVLHACEWRKTASG
jgi:amino-acid N-acetyltransferase